MRWLIGLVTDIFKCPFFLDYVIFDQSLLFVFSLLSSEMSHRSGTNGTPSQSDTVKDPLCFPNVSNGNDKDNKGDVPLINFEEDGGSSEYSYLSM